MSIKRSTSKAARLVAFALLTTVSLSACVGSYTEYYDDEYYPEERTVVVKHTRPVYRRVDVYDTRPTVIYTTRPNTSQYYRHRNNHYYGSTYIAPPSTTSQVIVRKNKHYNNDEQTVILNPGRHQQQKVIVRPYSQQQNMTIVKPYTDNNSNYNSSTSVVKPYHQTVVKSHHYNKTHDAPPPRSAEVKHSKKIVIERPGDAPPSTLAE
jgi:hypothetical protein